MAGPVFAGEAYKQQNIVGRCINKLSHRGNGLAIRYDKAATIYLAGLHLAILIWSAR
ncbi:hypothetical protein [Streptomyces sp. NPDC031705]|uniref:hypothetical protein n=1 Tax=Streptomyces sp. NPDC031705 TaxID=3155729 RepID=UPI0033CCCFB7